MQSMVDQHETQLVMYSDSNSGTNNAFLVRFWHAFQRVLSCILVLSCDIVWLHNMYSSLADTCEEHRVVHLKYLCLWPYSAVQRLCRALACRVNTSQYWFVGQSWSSVPIFYSVGHPLHICYYSLLQWLWYCAVCTVCIRLCGFFFLLKCIYCFIYLKHKSNYILFFYLTDNEYNFTIYIIPSWQIFPVLLYFRTDDLFGTVWFILFDNCGTVLCPI